VIDGRSHYLGEWNTAESKERYAALVKRITADRVKEEMRERVEMSTDITIAEIVVRYVVHVEQHYVKAGQQTTQVALVKRAIRVVRELHGGLEAVDFGPRALKECRQRFIELGWCRNEVNRAVRLIVQLFKWAVSEELIPASVWQSLKSVRGLEPGRTPAPDHPPVGPVDESVVQAVAGHVSPTIGSMLLLQAATGMRPQEIVQMVTGDLVMNDSGWTYTPRRHKNQHKGIDRIIPIGPEGRAVLRAWLKTDLAAPIFPTPSGGFYSPPVYRNAVVIGLFLIPSSAQFPQPS
jgi:integrase